MRSIRRQLTIGYIGALAVTMTIFGAILYVDRRQAGVTELDQRLEVESDLTVRYLQDLYRSFGRLQAVVAGTLEYFRNFRHILVLVSREGQVVLSNDPAATLDTASLERLRERALIAGGDRVLGSITLRPSGTTLRYLVVPVTGSDPVLGTMLVAADIGEVSFVPAALLRSMLVTAPVVLILSLLLGYSLAGGALRPLEQVVAELAAITDGRSLHRRLAVDRRAPSEVATLVHAVNGMFARLEASFAAQHRFVADASHELKTPLMVFRAGVERALTSDHTPPESLQSLDESLREVNRMSELVENLLTLARADEGSAPLTLEECDLRALVNEAAETAQILAEERGVTVTTRLPDRPVPIPLDPTRIRQLLLNLVTNAVKYSQAEGEVSLRLRAGRDDVILEVQDTGVGIAAGDLPHIFDRFWRADPVRPREGDRTGSGLGLAITKWIAEAHGGTIDVQSRPGRGTVFTVSLPRATKTVG